MCDAFDELVCVLKEIISKYNSDLVTKAADLLVEKWGTEHYPLPAEMKSPYMRMIRLPDLKEYTQHHDEPAYKVKFYFFIHLWEYRTAYAIVTAVI
jgi:hypothetical protein